MYIYARNGEFVLIQDGSATGPIVSPALIWLVASTLANLELFHINSIKLSTIRLLDKSDSIHTHTFKPSIYGPRSVVLNLCAATSPGMAWICALHHLYGNKNQQLIILVITIMIIILRIIIIIYIITIIIISVLLHCFNNHTRANILVVLMCTFVWVEYVASWYK